MGITDVGDDPVIRFGNLAQVFDLAGMVGSHLHDTEFGVGIHAKQGEWHTDMVVEVAFGGNGFILFREYSVAQFFRGGLAVRSGDA